MVDRRMWQLFILTITRPREAFKGKKEQRIKLFLVLISLAGVAMALSRIASAPPGISGIIGFVLGSVLMMVFITGVGWMVMSLVLLPLVGGRNYFDALGVVGLSWMPIFFYYLLRAGYMAIVGEPLITAIPLTLLEHLNPFVLWSVALQAIGFSVVFETGLSRGAIFSTLYRVLLLLGSLAMVHRA